ncbi:GT4 family glycosyltransferase PelF [Methanocaldococcus sp. 28A]
MKKVTIIAEGSYPQKLGGVSIWTHNLVSNLLDFEFNCISLTNGEKIIRYKSKNLKEIFWIDIGKPEKNIDFVDHEITKILTYKMLNGEELNIKDLKNLNRFCISSPEYFNVLLDIYIKDKLDIAFSHYFWSISNYFIIVSQIARNINKMLNKLFNNTDILFSLNVGFCGILGCSLKYKLDKPLIVSEHGIILEEIKNLLNNSKIKKEVHKYIINIYKSMMLTTYKHCDLVTSISDFHKEHSIRNGCNPNKIKVIYTGIDTKKFVPPDKKDYSKIIVGNVSRIDSIKGTKEYVEIANYIVKRLKNIEFWHIGPIEDIKYAKEVFNLNKKYGYPVKFLGPTNDPLKFYQRIHLYLNTSLSEGLPLSVLEAQSCGVPAICSNVGACKYICYIYYNMKQDKEKYLEDLLNIFKGFTPEKIKKASKDVRKMVVEKYDIRKMVEEYRKVFKEFS